ncbi:fungal-specific transcription factor domain-containing protein [Dissophora ornata]|nr:hypothetical protein BGZ58_008642 [Dissophora ornata]KAI8604753.1 fungal-specific transcription factor domain-containing protein [Dissophora ornata]
MQIKCDRLEPTCSSCIKYKATCVRTAFPAGAPLSTVSVDAIGGPGLRVLTPGKRDRHLTETEILDSCMRDVKSLQLNRLRRIEQFFDRLGIDETRLDEVGWIAEQIKLQQEATSGSEDARYHPEEVIERLSQRASVSWVKQLMPLLQATKRVQQIPTTAHSYPKSSSVSTATNALQATLTESGQFICPAPKPIPFPTRVPLSVLNKTVFELSVYDSTQYLGPVAGTKATSWSEEMRFPFPWLVPEPQVQESLLVLPPMEQMLELIEWMIQSPLYTFFPMLTKASILNALTSAILDPDGPSLGGKPHSQVDAPGESTALPQRITGRVSAVFLLNAIMALGAAYRSNAIKENTPHKLLTDPKSRERDLHEFQLFFDRSRALTVYILDQPRISSLQGLLLLMKCPAIPGIQNLYREQACAMALSLGLHRDPEPWTLCQSVIQLRRNIFWCCYVIDASYSLNSGSPERFPDDYITVGLPMLPSIEFGDDVGDIDAESETHRIGFLIEQAKLWRIVKKIRRCGQTSNKTSESYCEGANLFRGPETAMPPSTANLSPPFGYPANNAMGQIPYSPYGAAKVSEPACTQPPWIWRADSARRILDVELAQWQMELPPHLRFDFSLTRKDSPCPFEVRVNGLGAMLQLIFNEVLILLHHPFLVFADSQSQPKRDQGINASNRNPKSRSSTSPIKSSRSQSSSSSTKLSSSPLSDDSISKASRSLPPFLNSCTKAAEAITFLIDHLLRTTPEWLVCHSEVESTLHIAERVHALNVTMSANSNAPSGGSIYAAHVNGRQARSQLIRTRAFRKTIKELDQFTMSTGYRPEFMTKEMFARGSPRERLVRSMKQLLTHKHGSGYYRLPRSPPEHDQSNNGSQPEGGDRHVESGAGQDHLEMRLSFVDGRIWIRHYNIRIKDGIESRNGAESWIEILNPYSPPDEVEVDTDTEEDSVATHLFGYSSPEEISTALYESEDSNPGNSNKQRLQRQRNGSMDDKSDVADGSDELMDPPQSSSTALMEIFSSTNPSGLVNFTDMVAGSTYYPNQNGFANKKDFGKDFGVIEPGFDIPIYNAGSYAPQDVPLEGFDRIEPPMSLDGPSQGLPHGADMYQPEHLMRGFHVAPPSSQQGRHQSFQASTTYAQPSYQLQQHSHRQVQQPRQHSLQHDQHSSFSTFDVHAPSIVRFDPAITSPVFSAPESSIRPATEATMGLRLLTVSTPLSLQSPVAFEGGPYLSLLQQQFPHQHIPTQPHSTSSMQSFQQQQPLNPSLGAVNQSIRPFFGMPMGGFMAPTLDPLPEISRNILGHRSVATQPTNFLSPVTTSGHQQLSPSAAAWSPDSQAAPGSTTSFVPRSEPLSPALPPLHSPSVPASPLQQSSLKMVLSPTADAMLRISNKLNSWSGLSETKTDSTLDFPSKSGGNGTLSTFEPTLSTTTTAILDQNGTAQYASSWSSPSTSSDLATTNSSTPGSTVLSDGHNGTNTGVFSTELRGSANDGNNNDSTLVPLTGTKADYSMDGVEASCSSSSSALSFASVIKKHDSINDHHQRNLPHQHHHHVVSAVPEASLGDFGTSSPDDSVQF